MVFELQRRLKIGIVMKRSERDLRAVDGERQRSEKGTKIAELRIRLHLDFRVSPAKIS